MKQLSKTQLQTENESLRKDNGVLLLALNSLVARKVRWLRGKQRCLLGLCRLTEAHGGIVIQKGSDYASAHYLEDFLLSLSYDRTDNPWRALAQQALQLRNLALDEDKAPRPLED